MGVRVSQFDRKKDKMTYALVPEVIKDEELLQNDLNQLKKDNMYNDGWSDDRRTRYLGSIPQEMWYNVPRMNGCKEAAVYWADKKNIKKFFEDFPAFKINKQ